MQIREIMHEGVQVISHKKSVEDAARLMEQGDFGSLPVEKNDKMVGMITDRDITIRVIAKGKNPKTTKVGECMSEGINFCFEVGGMRTPQGGSPERDSHMLDKETEQSSQKTEGVIKQSASGSAPSPKPMSNNQLIKPDSSK